MFSYTIPTVDLGFLSLLVCLNRVTCLIRKLFCTVIDDIDSEHDLSAKQRLDFSIAFSR